MVATGLAKRYGRHRPWVFQGLDLELGPGALTVVFGANGCGKSTLLRVLAGVSPATRGSMTGRPARVGYVPERLPARLQMSARAYLAHMGRLHGAGGRAAEVRAEELAERLALRPSLDAPIGSLSKGNSQKVALAQALLAPVGLLLLDEPWSGLDPHAAAGLDFELKAARERGAAVLSTAHGAGGVPGADRYLELGAAGLRALTVTPPTEIQAVVLCELVPPAGWQGKDGPPPWMAGSPAEDAGDFWRLELPSGAAVGTVLAQALSEGWSVRLVADRRRLRS